MYKFYGALEVLLEKKNYDGNVIMKDIMVAVNPLFDELPVKIQDELLTIYSHTQSIFDSLHRAYINMNEFESSAQQSLGQQILSYIPFKAKSQSQIQSEEYQLRYEKEYRSYKSFETELRTHFDAINTKIESAYKVVKAPSLSKEIEIVTNNISVADESMIHEFIVNEKKNELESFLKSKINLRLIELNNLVMKATQAFGCVIDLQALTKLNDKYNNLITKYLAELFFTQNSINHNEVKTKLGLYLAEYKNELLQLNKDNLNNYSKELRDLKLSKDLRKYAAIKKYDWLSATISKASTKVMDKILSNKQVDDFSFTLMLTGSLTNSAILTFLHQNCIPYFSVIKNVLFLVYGSLLTFYGETLYCSKKMEENNADTLVNKLIIYSKLILPALVMVISFVFLAPFFNDFLLALIIPASMSIALNICYYIMKSFSNIAESYKSTEKANERLDNIFGHELAKRVALYYKNKIESLQKQVSMLENKRHLTLSETLNEKLKIKRDELLDLQKEWRALSIFNASSHGLTTEQSREIYFIRISKSAMRKENKQYKSCMEQKSQLEQEINQLNSDLGNSIDEALKNTSGLRSSVRHPMAFIRLAEKKTERQAKIDRYAFEVATDFLPRYQI